MPGVSLPGYFGWFAGMIAVMAQIGGVAQGRLGDWISLEVLASRAPRDAVDEAIGPLGKGGKRKGGKRKGGKLPPHVIGYFAMALTLFAEEDHEESSVRLSETRLTEAAGDLPQAR